MRLFKWLQQMFQYVLKGASRIFGPNDDEYPTAGIQPFEGEPFDERQ